MGKILCIKCNKKPATRRFAGQSLCDDCISGVINEACKTVNDRERV